VPDVFEASVSEKTLAFPRSLMVVSSFGLGYGEGMKYLIMAFQILIAFGVFAANIYWQWTPNGYLAGAWAFMAAYAATVGPLWVIDRLKGRNTRFPWHRS
jgi:hypothetical protein